MSVRNLPLKGLTFKDIRVVSGKDSFDYEDTIYFLTEDDELYKMSHDQECCESGTIDDIIGNLEDLIGSPLTMAEEVQEKDDSNEDRSATWTFYKFATNKGYVTIKWYGVSNGWYSETADIYKVEEDSEIDEESEIQLILSTFFNKNEIQEEVTKS